MEVLKGNYFIAQYLLERLKNRENPDICFKEMYDLRSKLEKKFTENNKSVYVQLYGDDLINLANIYEGMFELNFDKRQIKLITHKLNCESKINYFRSFVPRDLRDLYSEFISEVVSGRME